MNYSTTLLRLTKAVFLVATLLRSCTRLSAVSQVQQVRIRAQIVWPTGTNVTTAPAQDGELEGTESSPSPRDHFKQIMRTYYTAPHTGGTEELASFFSVAEMYRLGPLATDPGVDNPPSVTFIDISQDLCQRMVDRLNTQQSTSDFCHWIYTCNYNENRFPSMIINATHCTAANGARCIQRVTNMQTFIRTFVGIEPTWRRDEELTSVTYAYTCRMR